ncbi:unnamed protein product [Acanthoscelides obtectus]|uniref:Uncharacterized protein n=1 Tax=Acanthoscelides obtectus TaxID=200917 RepID=A0A9P0KWS0_ACAOB|nr:unnamed protein product [Acanthoscelides obtectus]CAK1656090.1 hypothetical protein AOBTE_LOCUS19568 [Acanthoscelides obtectus]
MAKRRHHLEIQFLLSYIFKFSTQSVSVIVPEVCDALIACLSDKIKMPKRREERLQVANDFNRMWNYLRCCGSIDGKHICLQATLAVTTSIIKNFLAQCF